MALKLFKKKPKKGEAEVAADGADAAAAATPPAEGEDGAEGAPKKKGLPIKLIAIGAVVGLVLVGGGGGAFMMFGPKPAPDAGAHGAKDAHGKDKKAKKKKKKEAGGHGGDAAKPGAPGEPVIVEGPDGVVFYTLPDMVVNMQTADGKPTFLKLKLTLELPDHDVVDLLGPARPRLQDMFQTFLRELRPEDLAGSQGSYQLRMEILRRVNLVIAPAKINAVLIEEMLIN
jgi:flagellar protein FliL